MRNVEKLWNHMGFKVPSTSGTGEAEKRTISVHIKYHFWIKNFICLLTNSHSLLSYLD